MKVILFGASGMVGQGVLRECLLDPQVEAVRVVVRHPLGQTHAKLDELVLADVSDLSSVTEQVRGYDACFFPLGVSATGMTEDAYRKLTHDLTLGAARTLAELSPGMTFIYVSGAGTDSTEHGRVMWARVKGATENALLRLPFKAVHLFRPGMIQPLHGIRSKTRAYDLLYGLIGFLIPLLRRMFPNHITTTEEVGRAMIEVARHGWPQPVLECRDIIAAGRK